MVSGSWLAFYFITKGKNLTLLFYALSFGVGLPVIVARWWSKAKTHSKNKILNSTMSIFYRELKDEFSFRQTIELISKADEFEFLHSGGNDVWEEHSKNLKNKMEELKIVEKSFLFGKKVWTFPNTGTRRTGFSKSSCSNFDIFLPFAYSNTSTIEKK